MPDDWCSSVICPIYKNKGDHNDPNNYRGISLLSCFGKLFTSLNRRLTIFIENNNIVQAEQAGFKSDFSTIDHLIVLKSLADLYLRKRKRLYCCFVDYKKAFDTINRSTLWSKMLASGISGKLFDVTKNMYEKAKSSVALTAEAQSDFFTCNIGVRQGENLSPLLFSIYLHDLKSFISRTRNGVKDIENMQREHLYEEFVTYFKLCILLYADDTVILAENPKDLQASLDEMKKYCDSFDLHINVNKTKILFFSRGKLRRHHILNFGNFILDTVEEYNYLGLVFNYNAKFKIAKSHLYQKGCRAMFALLKRSRNLSLPMVIMLKLFNVLVKPVVLYGAEGWGSEKCDILERFQLRFFKYVFSVNKFTSSMMVYGELGGTPLDIDIKSRMLTFWARLCSGDKHKIYNTIYSLLYTLDKKDIFKSEWIETVKTTLNNYLVLPKYLRSQ